MKNEDFIYEILFMKYGQVQRFEIPKTEFSMFESSIVPSKSFVPSLSFLYNSSLENTTFMKLHRLVVHVGCYHHFYDFHHHFCLTNFQKCHSNELTRQSFLIFGNKNNLKNLFRPMNSRHPNFQFTWEEEFSN